MNLPLLSRVLAFFAITGALLGQTSNYRILFPPHPDRAYGFGFGQTDPGLAGSSDLWPSVGGRGYSVAMGKGELSMVIPVATVPGEIPIPLSFRLNASRAAPVVLVGIYQSGPGNSPTTTQTISAGSSDSNSVSPLIGTGGGNGYYSGFLNLYRPVFGTVDFGFISSSDTQYVPGTDFDFPGKLGKFSPKSYVVLEDGRVLSSVMDFSTMTGTFSLPPLFGFTAKAASAVTIDTSGTLVNYTAVSTDLGSWTSKIVAPSGFTTGTHTGYQVVMDRDRARVYAYAAELYAWIPVLWVDRFGHWVTFKWQNVTTGLPTGIAAVRAVTATNHRGNGVQVQWAEPTAGSSAPNQILLRADFINVQAPTLQATGYADLATGGYYSMLPLAGGPVLRPTQLEIGNPGMALPSPNWTVLPVPLPVANPEPWPTYDQLWEFAYNSVVYPSDQLKTFTDNLGLMTSVTWTPTSIVDPNAASLGAGYPLDSYDSVQTLTSTDSGVTLTQAFTWNLPTTSTAPSWTSTYQKTFSGSQGWNNNQAIATADNPVTTYTFYPPSDLKYGNGALQQLQVAVGSTALSTKTYTYTTGLGINGSAQGPQEIDTTIQFTPLSREVFSLDTATGSVLSHYRTSGFYQDQLTYSYDRHPEYLDPNRCITVTNANSISGTTVSTREQDTVYNLTTFLPTQSSKGGSSGKIGSAFTYATGSGFTNGHLQAISPYASGSLFSAAPSGGERTTTIALDPTSALPTQASTTYYGPSGYTNSFTQQSYVYDSMDRTTSYLDGLGATVGTSYDAWGRVVGTSHSGQASTSTTYPTMLQAITQRNARTDTRNTNAFGQCTTHSRGSDGVVETYSYDQNGQVVSVSELSPGGKTRSHGQTWDGLGRPLTTVPVVGPTASYTYAADRSGTQTVTCGYSGQTFTTSQTRDIWGNVISDTDPYGTVTTRSFDSYGRVTASTMTPNGGDPQGRSYTYTDWGLATRQDPETGLTNYGTGLYNVLGQPNTIVENDGRARTLTYDGLGRLRSVVSGTDAVSTSYNGLFLAYATTTSSTLASSVTYTPDAIGRVAQESVLFPGVASPRTIIYSYDPTDGCRLASITYPENGIVGYNYDDVYNFGRLTTVTLGGQTLATLGYDQEGWGHLGSVAFNGRNGSGASDTWDYTDDGTQIKKETLNLPGQAPTVRAYGYDALNHFNQAGEWAPLTHDVLGRLTQANYAGANVSLQPDWYGNNISSQAGASPGFNNFTFNPLSTDRELGTATNGAITGWTYDGDGESQSLYTAIGQGSSHLGFTWDKLGRLASVSLPSQAPAYAYLPNGCRAQVVDTMVPANNRQYLYNTSGLLLGEYTGAGSSWAWKRSVIYAGNLAIAEFDGQGVHELHADHLGTPLVVTRTGVTGNEGSQFFGPYGETLPPVYPVNGTYQPLTGYTGHIQTDPTGLIYMRGRYYSPQWHCFLNPDKGADPSQLNQYAYCGGNPMMNVDPSGMSWLSSFFHHLGHALSVDWNHVRHQADVNWDNGREDIEIAAAVTACIMVDVASSGAAAGTNSGIMASVGGAANAIGCPALTNTIIGAAAGGSIGGTWRSAAEGAVFGFTLGSLYSWSTSPGGFWSAAKQGLSGILGPVGNAQAQGPLWEQWAVKTVEAGVLNTAEHGGSSWVNCRGGLLEGGILGGIGCEGPSNPVTSVIGYFGNQLVGELIYRKFEGITIRFDTLGQYFMPGVNAGGYSLGLDVDLFD